MVFTGAQITEIINQQRRAAGMAAAASRPDVPESTSTLDDDGLKAHIEEMYHREVSETETDAVDDELYRRGYVAIEQPDERIALVPIEDFETDG